jgi:ABC-2 type transport system ATP-binding protein
MIQDNLILPVANNIQAQTTAPIIEVNNLVKRYKKAEKNAVDHILLSVAPGELYVMLGPNGAGKTTTTSILTTTLAPTSGSVRIAGYDIATQSHQVRQQIGIIFQKPSLDLNLTAEENVRLHATLYGLYPYRPTFRLMPQGYRNQVHTLAEILGIEESLFKPVKNFSGGMKRKLEIVRSLLHQPAVLFLDEPTTGLDPESRHSLWEHLRLVRAESGTTVFLNTHYLEEAEHADRICIINHGQIVSSGTPQQLKADLTPATLLIDAQDREQLRTELHQLGLHFQEEELFSVQVENWQVHQLLKKITVPLHVVKTFTPSIEDVYLRMIKED